MLRKMATILRSNVSYVYTVEPFCSRLYSFHSYYVCVFKVMCDLSILFIRQWSSAFCTVKGTTDMLTRNCSNILKDLSVVSHKNLQKNTIETCIRGKLMKDCN